MKLLKDINSDILSLFRSISEIAEKYSAEVYVVGGFVRDTILQVTNKDLDFVVVGDGIAFAKIVKETLNGDFIVTYNKFGTAKVGLGGLELEFVGARSEKYSPNSRKPIVEDADLASDLARRDFTINAMAIDLSSKDFGKLVDLYNGIADLKNGIIKTPLEPNITFIDDPLRIMRAIRFATRFKYTIEKQTYKALKSNAHRLNIISYERITEELKKTFESKNSALGLTILYDTTILHEILPEIDQATLNDVKKLCLNENISNWGFKWTFALLCIAQKMNEIELKTISKRFKFSNEQMNDLLYLSKFEMNIRSLFSGCLSVEQLQLFLYKLGTNYLSAIHFYKEFIPVKNVDEKISELIERDDNGKFTRFELAINGAKIQTILNLEKGKRIGEVKEILTENVLSNKIENDANELILFCKKIV